MSNTSERSRCCKSGVAFNVPSRLRRCSCMLRTIRLSMFAIEARMWSNSSRVKPRTCATKCGASAMRKRRTFLSRSNELRSSASVEASVDYECSRDSWSGSRLCLVDGKSVTYIHGLGNLFTGHTYPDQRPKGTREISENVRCLSYCNDPVADRCVCFQFRHLAAKPRLLVGTIWDLRICRILVVKTKEMSGPDIKRIMAEFHGQPAV